MEKRNVRGTGTPEEREPAAADPGSDPRSEGHGSLRAAAEGPPSGGAPRPRSAELEVENRSAGGRSRLVFGIFPDLRKASTAMLALEERGFAPEDITLRLSKETRDVIEGRRVFRDQRGGTYVARASLALRRERAWKSGLAIGALLGGAAGAVAATFTGPPGAPTLAIYGFVFLTRAIVAWAIVGFAAAIGATLGAAAGLTRSHYAARDYETARALEGAIVGVGVHDDAEADAIERTLRSRGAEIVSSA